MRGADAFFDTSVLLYLLSEDTIKADRAEELLAAGGSASVQVLNEFMSVSRRKLGMQVEETREVLDTIRTVCKIEPISVETHDRAVAVHQRYKFAFFDAVLIASALIADSKILYSEDFQHGQLIDRQLRVINPFIHA